MKSARKLGDRKKSKKSELPSSSSKNLEAPPDERFSGVLNNPIFRSVPKNEKKISIDKRFESMFHDKGFKLKYKVDKRGRPVNSSTDDNLRKYYNLEDEDDGQAEIKEEVSEDDSTSSSSSSEEEEKEEIVQGSSKLPDSVKKLLHSNKVDYARGEGEFVSEESSDGDATSEGEDEDAEEQVEHEWGELDKDAGRTEESTRRLALCNMDWDRIKASDLMLLFASFLPPGGTLDKVSIYPSEFGKERMAEEDTKGPLELKEFKKEYNSEDEEKEVSGVDAQNGDDSDNDEGSEYHREKMRQYQLNRLKYFYALLDFNSVQAAEKVYNECDGMEYESSSAKIDLRFVPEDMEFDEVAKDTCDAVPEAAKYRPKFFTTTALQQVKVACTWDETDPTRKDLIARVLDPKEKVDDEDLRAYLASSSEEEVEEESKDEGEHDQLKSISDPIAKYRMLLDSIEKKEESKKKDVELEITWGVGLKQKAEELVKKKSKEEEIKKMTPWEERLVKQKEKRRQKKAGKSGAQSESDDSDDDPPFSDDDVDVDMNDPFFKQDLLQLDTGGGGKKKKCKEKKDDYSSEQKGELDLLLLEDNHTDGKNHFNYKKILASEGESKSKSKRKRKLLLKNKRKHGTEAGSEGVHDDEFQVNVEDDRFSALFSSHHYNIDPSEPQFKRTKGMESLIKAKHEKKHTLNPNIVESQEKGSQQKKKSKDQAELAYLVNSIKNKSKVVAKTKRNRF